MSETGSRREGGLPRPIDSYGTAAQLGWGRFRLWLSRTSSIWAEHAEVLIAATSVIGACFWITSLWGQPLELNGYGLLPSLTPAYWLGTLMCAAAFLVAALKRPHRTGLLILTLAMLAATLYLTPTLLEGTPRFYYSYVSLGYADYIARYGEIRPETFTYHNWPALHIVLAGLLKLGVSPTAILLVGPLLFAPAFIAVVWGIGLLISGQRSIAWLGAGAFAVASQNANYVLPATAGFLLSLAAVTLTIYLWVRPTGAAKRRLLMSLILILCGLTVATHLLSSVYLLIFLAGIELVRRLGFGRTAAAPALTVAVILVAWQIYVASNFTLATLPAAIREVLQLDSVYSNTQRFAFSGSVEHSRVVWLRMGIYALVAAMAGVAWLLERRRTRKPTPTTLVLALGIAVPVSTVLLTSYNGEILSRVVGFAFPFLVIAVATLARYRFGRYVVAGFVLLATIVYPVYAYGNELIDYVSPAELVATEYIVDEVQGPYRLTNASIRTVGVGRIEDLYTGRPVSSITITGEPFERESQFWGRPTPEPPQSPECGSPAYDNGGVKVYVCPAGAP